MPTAIEFENISKQYRLGLVSTNTISHDLKRWWVTNIQGKEDPYLKIGEVNDRAHKGQSDYVWALKDINFKVEQGDVLGIIGKNGAGKSTLLKILSKVTAPSTGAIRARGRIASLLEVGTGFHPEMTGRENIFMNGAIMGMTKQEISRKLDEIVDFSGVERYLDTPVKRYSSGMTVRLGFAIAAHLEPEILVVDEVLAVGDAEFQKKAIGKMQDVSKGEGRTVLFVSHNMGAIEQLCKSLVILKNGQIDQITNDVKVGINRYIGLNDTNILARTYFETEPSQKSTNNYFILNKFFIGDERGNTLRNPQSNAIDKYLYFDFDVLEINNSLDIGYQLLDQNNQVVYFSQHNDTKSELWPKIEKGKNILCTKIPSRFLNEGIYRISLAVSLHEIDWLINPEISDTYLTLEIIGGLSDSPTWNKSRQGIIAPVFEWGNLNI